MKYCEEYAALLDLYVDGELSPEEMAAVQEHLDQCPDCRRYVDEILEIRAAFPDVEETPVPEGFADGVMEASGRISRTEKNCAPENRTPLDQGFGASGGMYRGGGIGSAPAAVGAFPAGDGAGGPGCSGGRNRAGGSADGTCLGRFRVR